MQNSMSKLTKWLGGLVGVAALGGGGYWGYQQWQASNDPAAAVAKDGTKAADAKGDGKANGNGNGPAHGEAKGNGSGPAHAECNCAATCIGAKDASQPTVTAHKLTVAH